MKLTKLGYLLAVICFVSSLMGVGMLVVLFKLAWLGQRGIVIAFLICASVGLISYFVGKECTKLE